MIHAYFVHQCDCDVIYANNDINSLIIVVSIYNS